ncbi:MAG: heat-inducible transcriptional repressor HrcA [Bacteroidetes bacterium]|nr:heat-inducible transcriptional repressor HrcA [Bacteroidota bacterium]MCL5737653.1 heat-inducible transcriptional repressor HrcA [Bacteroidota bacterium]
MRRELTQREKEVLREVIHDFILTANPVASKFIAQKQDVNLSPATIRNVMAQLEEFGYLNHPHTSAGRVPTDKGYRFYLDSLISFDALQENERDQIAFGLNASLDSSELLSEASKLLGKVSKQLSLVSAPYIGDAILTKIELMSLNSSKVLVVISLETGLIKTIVLEVESEVSPHRLKNVNSLLNERLAGLKLSEIRETIVERVGDYADEEVISRFTSMSERIFAAMPETDKVHIGMPQGILSHPEFELPENLKGILEIVGDENVILHILEKSDANEPVTVKVGAENSDEKLKDYSLITARYEVGGVKGTVGIVGPRRMQYSRLIPLVDFVAKVISNKLNS